MFKCKLLSTALILLSFVCCTEDKDEQPSKASEADLKIYETYKSKGFVDKGGYLYQITSETQGVKAKNGDVVWVHDTGKFLNGVVLIVPKVSNLSGFN